MFFPQARERYGKGKSTSQAYSEQSETSKMEMFAKISCKAPSQMLDRVLNTPLHLLTQLFFVKNVQGLAIYKYDAQVQFYVKAQHQLISGDEKTYELLQFSESPFIGPGFDSSLRRVRIPSNGTGIIGRIRKRTKRANIFGKQFIISNHCSLLMFQPAFYGCFAHMQGHC